ncbi:PhzF family phenazine biosynthesis protein [Streptomyces sp. 6N223]|uniref:PhzF family phenazine biosynthesis protein n=1 Tax=Streptomyces sp. 6N223 TaxID=3457412 RepID=UPI003FD2308B
MDYTFFLADVFTQRRFGGNQLAVFPDARGLSADDMQALAREFNFSETTFVLPPEDPAHDPGTTRRLRIFTPQVELPFAGHPTVGTAAVLAAADEALSAGKIVLEEGVGPVEVEVTGGPTGAYSRFTVNAPFDSPGHTPPVDAVAAALSLPPEAIRETWYGGVGVRFCYARLVDAATVDRAVLDHAAWSGGVAGGWSPNIYLFAGDFRDGGHLHARSFVPEMGIPEDPATGAACAGLIAGLAVRGGEASPSLSIDQGVAMGRPSQIEASARTDADGGLAGVSIGGHTVIVGSGTITL